jgi:hypothetical protein
MGRGEQPRGTGAAPTGTSAAPRRCRRPPSRTHRLRVQPALALPPVPRSTPEPPGVLTDWPVPLLIAGRATKAVGVPAGDLGQRLLEASGEGRSDDVAQLLSARAGPGIPKATVTSALMMAALKGRTEVVLLLAAGAAVDHAENSPERLTPLWMAVIGGQGGGGCNSCWRRAPQ